MRWRDFDLLPPLDPSFFDVARRVHFVGVGGIGMSALAKLLTSRGHFVSGSDAHDSPALAALRDANVKTFVGHRAENLHAFDAPAEALIFSSAVTSDNPERQEAARLSVPQHHRGQMLAYFVNTAKISIAVSGTHGKSTTSAMIAHILTECGHNPTAILGANYSPFGGNLRVGNPDLLVVEADESDGSFTLLTPTVAVVTNVEPEHLENYDDRESELWRAFEMFAKQAQFRVINVNDLETAKRLHVEGSKAVAFCVISNSQDEEQYGVAEEFDAVYADDVRSVAGDVVFSLNNFVADTEGLVNLTVPGLHNVANATGALLAAWRCGVEQSAAKRAIAHFHGIARRFEKKGEARGVTVYDDYAHHPTEVRATLEAARDFLGKPVTVIFQPHRFSRTQQMGRDFGPSFEAADRVIVTELYSAFEEPIPDVSGRIVFDALRDAFPDKPAHFAPTLDDARRQAVAWAQPGDVVFTMGAGDVSRLGPLLLQDLEAL